MKKLTLLALTILMFGSLSQALQFAYKCTGTLPDPQGHMDDMAISGIINSHTRFLRGTQYHSAGAVQLNSDDPIVLQDESFMIANQYLLELVDKNKQIELWLALPFSLEELTQKKPGDVAPYMTGGQIRSLNSSTTSIDDNSWTKNKISCEGTIVNKSSDGFQKFWSSLSSSLGNALAKSVWPQFNN